MRSDVHRKQRKDERRGGKIASCSADDLTSNRIDMVVCEVLLQGAQVMASTMELRLESGSGHHQPSVSVKPDQAIEVAVAFRRSPWVQGCIVVALFA